MTRTLGLLLGLAIGCSGVADGVSQAAGAGQSNSPEGVSLVLSEDCRGATCHHLKVRCEELPKRDVVVREFDGGGSRGTVLFTTGVFGGMPYDKEPVRKATVDALRNAGFQVFQVEWGGGQRGWGAGAEGAGLSRALCAYAQVVRWVVANEATNGQVACAQGNSGGALQNAYGLAVHGLEKELDMVVMSGGPPVTQIESFCFGRPQDSGAKASGRRFLDTIEGWKDNRCQTGTTSPEAVATSNADSLVNAKVERDYDYPATTLHFVLSEGDRSRIEAKRFYDAVKSSKEWHWVPGHSHGVDATAPGATLIRRLFEQDCRQR